MIGEARFGIDDLEEIATDQARISIKPTQYPSRTLRKTAAMSTGAVRPRIRTTGASVGQHHPLYESLLSRDVLCEGWHFPKV